MTRYRLLVIEDSKHIADLICRAADEAGFETRSATGATATDVYHDFVPDAIALDILMPEMDGFEFLKFLKERGSAARIIIISGSSDAYRRIAETLGTAGGLIIEANIPKPFRLDDVWQILEKIRKSLDHAAKYQHHSA